MMLFYFFISFSQPYRCHSLSFLSLSIFSSFKKYGEDTWRVRSGHFGIESEVTSIWAAVRFPAIPCLFLSFQLFFPYRNGSQIPHVFQDFLTSFVPSRTLHAMLFLCHLRVYQLPNTLCTWEILVAPWGWPRVKAETCSSEYNKHHKNCVISW
jgi:hypothetical protein